MFGKGFENCWYGIPRVPGLELSGDLRFRGPRGLRKLRHDRNGRPYLLARKAVGPNSTGAAREGRVMLHRSVMTVVLGRQLDCDEFVCHGDDDSRNNWPGNLYLGDRLSNAADSLRNGRHARGDSHPCTKLLDAFGFSEESPPVRLQQRGSGREPAMNDTPATPQSHRAQAGRCVSR